MQGPTPTKMRKYIDELIDDVMENKAGLFDDFDHLAINIATVHEISFTRALAYVRLDEERVNKFLIIKAPIKVIIISPTVTLTPWIFRDKITSYIITRSTDLVEQDVALTPSELNALGHHAPDYKLLLAYIRGEAPYSEIRGLVEEE